MLTQISSLIEASAELIGHYDAALAERFRLMPFQRVATALAFAGGFPEARNEDSDPHPHALLVLEVALADREKRRAEVGN